MTPETIGQKGGLYCYLITPFNEAGNVDFATLERYTDAIISGGADGVTCVASTTEGVYLTEAERFAVTKAVCDTTDGRVPVNVAVGDFSTRQVNHWADQAQKVGASTLMLEMQTYLPDIHFQDVIQHYQSVSDNVDIPIRLYNIPRTTRYDMTPKMIAELAAVDGIDSVKDATGDPHRVRDIIALTGDRFALYTGLHFVARESYKYGAIGWEAAYHPLFNDDMVTLHQQLRAGDAAAATLYKKMEPLFVFFRQYGVPQCIRAMSAWSNLNLGQARAPLPNLSEQQSSQLKSLMMDLKYI
ncbi:MAG: dihydrodipicolinate synthase family protein [Litoreibacter sp.]|uniref:dihydrodipicolinate synthase family protein n=1 Tax=Litoreibacter sp. TaxID=1969459 RepID=UPI003296D622